MRKKTPWKSLLFLTIIYLTGTSSLLAQVTTATLSGIIKDASGAPLPAATVIIEFPDAGVRQTLTTKGDGRFTLANQRVGGPYKISVSHVGLQDALEQNIFLELGQNNFVEISMTNKSMELESVTVASSIGSKIFDNKRTGASTNISSTALRNLPTISRSADDYLRLAPLSFSHLQWSFFCRKEWAVQ